MLEEWRGKVLNFLREFGDISATIIGIYVLTMIVMWIAGRIWSCWALQGVAGRRRWIQPLLPTKWIVDFDYGVASRAARRNQRQEHTNEGAEFSSFNDLKARDDYDNKLLGELREDEGFDNS